MSPRAMRKALEKTEADFQDHTGFMLVDPQNGRTIIDYQADRFFTPASNTKILTLLAGVVMLGDSVPGLRYTIQDDTLYFEGTGDPSLLYREVYQNNRTIDFLQSAPYPLVFQNSRYAAPHFGPGWSWEDYKYAYGSERSPFPIYGNTFEVIWRPSKMFTEPPFFQSQLEPLKTAPVGGGAFVERSPFSNTTVFYPGRDLVPFTRILPFHWTPALFTELLSDTLARPVAMGKGRVAMDRALYSVPVDSLFTVMMQESDNFIAEQLLIMCSGTISDSLSPEVAIRHMLAGELADLPDKPVWVDGSGLSRYNLITPRSVVKLWQKLAARVPRERLFSWLAAGGQSGTIKNLYKSGQPYIYGKTGTLSHVHCLSGFLLARSGKTYIFSFMNANYAVSPSEIRKRMESFLAGVRDAY